MNPALATTLSGLFVLVGTVITAVLTSRSNRKGAEATAKLAKDANNLSERVVDREDFDAVMTRMEKDLERSDKRITDLERRLEAEVTAREKAEERAVAAEKRADEAERSTSRLERRVSQLEQVLRDHDIPVPPVVDA